MQLTSEEILKLADISDLPPVDTIDTAKKAYDTVCGGGELVSNLSTFVSDLIENGVLKPLDAQYGISDLSNGIIAEALAYLEYRVNLKDTPELDTTYWYAPRCILKDQPAILEQVHRDIRRIVDSTIDKRLRRARAS